MKISQICGRCGAGLKASTISLSWPSNIKCRECRASHRYAYAGLIGAAYVSLIIGVTLFIKAVVQLFPNVHDEAHSAGVIQGAVALLAPFIAILLLGPVYIRLLEKYGKIRLNDS
ncbi:MAG TPA: hypothetical protein VF050_09950 [Moraxellaceae bacterium]